MIDPNVWISGLINPRGTPARVIQAVVDGQVAVLVTEHLLEELKTVLARPKFRRWITLSQADDLVVALGIHAGVEPDPVQIPARVRDPDDDYLAAFAQTANAVLVTGDEDLLSAPLTPPAITPRQLLDRLTRP